MFGYVLVKIMVIIGCIAIIFLLSIETGIQIQFENWERKKKQYGCMCIQYVVYAHTPRYFAKHIKFSVLLLSKRTWICERKLMIRFLVFVFVFARFIFFRLFVYYKWLRCLLSANPLFLWLVIGDQEWLKRESVSIWDPQKT